MRIAQITQISIVSFVYFEYETISFQLEMQVFNRLFWGSPPRAALFNLSKLPFVFFLECISPRCLFNFAKTIRSFSSSSSTPKIREIKIEERENEVVVSANLRPDKTFLVPIAKEALSTPCPICRNDVNIRMEDVLVLRQFLNPHTHQLYSQEETGICDTQYEKLSEAVRLAQANNFLPRPEDYQMPYRFSERVSMQDVHINFLPHSEPTFVVVKGKFGLDDYED